MITKFFRFDIVYLIVGTFLVSALFYGGNSYAENDLLWQLIEPSYLSETTLNVGKDSKKVGDEVFEGSLEARIKFKKVIKTGEDGELLCHDGPCSEYCQVETDETKELCGNKWQYILVEVDVGKKPPMIVKATKLLLILVIALSVTMILYNGMMYIIQTGQGKEGKNLMKNIALIVVGILISLFSVVIIRLIQSIPGTIDDELISESNNETDNNVLEGDG